MYKNELVNCILRCIVLMLNSYCIINYPINILNEYFSCKIKMPQIPYTIFAERKCFEFSDIFIILQSYLASLLIFQNRISGQINTIPNQCCPVIIYYFS